MTINSLKIKSLKETNILLSICEEGNSDKIMEYFNNHPNIILSVYNYQIFHILCKNGNLDILIKLLKTDEEINSFDYNYFFITAIKSNQLKIIEYYFKYFNKFISVFDLISFSITEKKNNIFNYLKNYDDINKNINDYFENAVKNNNLEVLKDLINYKSNITINENDLLINAVVYERLESFNFIINNFNCFTNESDNENIFYNICYSSSISILQSFLKFNNTFDIKINNCNGLKNSILGENLDMTKYLLNLNPSQVDEILSNNYSIKELEQIFYDDFMSLDSYIYIYNLFPILDVTSNNHLFYKKCCENNEVKTALLLAKKHPELYYIEIQNNIIKKWFVNKKLIISSNLSVKEIEVCPICYSNESNVVTNCNHQYCLSCLEKINNLNDNILKCSICRQKVNQVFKISSHPH